jgi:phosphoribosylaminoimidazole (AIR) synthetase
MTHSASALGIIRPELKLFPQKNIKPGMPIIGLGERGYRCNGGTQFTRIIEKLWGAQRCYLLNQQGIGARDFIEALTAPSVIYAPFVADAHGWNRHGNVAIAHSGVMGITHITGGGVWSKLADMLPAGVGADLENMPNPPQVLLQAQQLAAEAGIPMSDHECYGTFHGGCGMMVVCQDKDAAKALLIRLDQLGLSKLVSVQQVGHTTESPDKEIRIQSRFAGRNELSSLRPPE